MRNRYATSMAARAWRQASIRQGVALVWVVCAAIFAAVPILPDTEALAQYESFPCPSGPGPGEVGIGPGPGGVPMCRSTGNGNTGGPQGPVVLPSRFHAVAWHPDYDDYWAAGGYSSLIAAKADAVALCNQDTGGGCTLAAWTENGAVALARRVDGALHAAPAKGEASARRAVLADCNAKSVMPCEIIGTHTSKSGARRPRDLVRARKLYGAAAWIQGDGYDRRLFVATGHRSMAEAEQAALNSCARSYSRPNCSIAYSAANGFFQVSHSQAANGQTSDIIVGGMSAGQAAQSAQRMCHEAKTKCLQRQSYDVRTPGLFVHDYGSAASAVPKR